MSVIYCFIQIFLAYLLVDFLTGLYHFATDKGWNFQYHVKLFNLHHETNTMESIDWQPAVVAIPALLYGLYAQSPFWIAGGIFGCAAQVPHYYAHCRSKSQIVHHLVRVLQLSGLIISPSHHAEHHNGVFDRNFCIFSGWNNRWMNPVILGDVSHSEYVILLSAVAVGVLSWFYPEDVHGAWLMMFGWLWGVWFAARLPIAAISAFGLLLSRMAF